jgi:hypothetical protein
MQPTFYISVLLMQFIVECFRRINMLSVSVLSMKYVHKRNALEGKPTLFIWTSIRPHVPKETYLIASPSQAFNAFYAA